MECDLHPDLTNDKHAIKFPDVFTFMKVYEYDS